MEAVKAGGVEIISFLQQSWVANHVLPLHILTYYCTPAFVLTVLFPVLLAVQGASFGKSGVSVSSAVALQVIWTAVVGLRLNTFRQWTMGEDRPYWWVKESARYTGGKGPELVHYPVTCLASPAAPTHSLLAAGAGIVVAAAIAGAVGRINFSCQKRRTLAVASVWCCYVIATVLVAIADTIFASHFPHQVVTSIIIGLSVGVAMLHMDWSAPSSLRRTFTINAVLLGISLSVMYRGEAVGSFNKYQQSSFRWCQRREWMQMDPLPLLDVFIFTGFALGTAAATASRYYRKLNKAKFSMKMLISLVILNLGVTQTLLVAFDAIPTSSEQAYVWAKYGGQLLVSALVPVLCAAFVPHFVQSASGVTSLSIKQKKQ